MQLPYALSLLDHPFPRPPPCATWIDAIAGVRGLLLDARLVPRTILPIPTLPPLVVPTENPSSLDDWDDPVVAYDWDDDDAVSLPDLYPRVDGYSSNDLDTCMPRPVPWNSNEI